MIVTRGQRSAVDRRPRRILGPAAAIIAAAGLVLGSLPAAVSAEGAAGAPLAVYRGGTITRDEFQGYQKRKLGAVGYLELLKDRAGLRAAVLRLALLEVIARVAGEAGLRKSAAFKDRLRQHENEMLAGLWRLKIQGEVTVDDAELDHMIPEPVVSVLVNWASLPSEEEAALFAASLRAGSDFPSAAKAAGVQGQMVGEARLSHGGESHFSPASQEKILSLAAGEVAGPLREPIGWYVVKATGRTEPAQERELERSKLRPEVLKRAREQAVADKTAALRAKAAIRVDEKVLADPGARAAGAKVALVNGEAVTFVQQELHGMPQHGEMEKLLRKQLDKQIDELLAAQEARRLKLAARDPEWAERMRGKELDLLHELYRERIFKEFEVDEDEVRDYYEKNPEQFKTNTMVRVKQIVLNSAYLAARYRADLLAGRLVFEELARRESIDRASALLGGDQGWLSEDNIREDLQEYVKALRPGEITVPVETDGVHYLIKLEARTEPELIPYDKSRERARSKALLAKRTSSWQAFLERKQKEAQVVLNEANFELLKPATP